MCTLTLNKKKNVACFNFKAKLKGSTN